MNITAITAFCVRIWDTDWREDWVDSKYRVVGLGLLLFNFLFIVVLCCLSAYLFFVVFIVCQFFNWPLRCYPCALTNEKWTELNIIIHFYFVFF